MVDAQVAHAVPFQFGVEAGHSPQEVPFQYGVEASDAAQEMQVSLGSSHTGVSPSQELHENVMHSDSQFAAAGEPAGILFSTG